MIRPLFGALLGAAAAAAALLAFTAIRPAILLELDADLPRSITNGFYPVEEVDDSTFAWTRPSATLTFRDIDRSVEWTCRIRTRAARPSGVPAAALAIDVDGSTVLRRAAPADYEEIEIRIPANRTQALSLTLNATPPYVPGTGDTRQLGLMVDRIGCTPASRPSPPRQALLAAAGAGGLFGLVLGLAPAAARVASIAALALAIGWVLSTGVGVYTRSYIEWILPLALWTTVPVVLLFAWRRDLTRAATAVVVFSAVAIFLKLAALLHPSKEIVDAVFHAHRLEWVMDGRYFFTQAMPGGVQFPYAIGLYVTATPLAALIRDHVALLRIVVIAFEALAALMLYASVARATQDRGWAAVAAIFSHMAPLPYVVIGNANLTFAFGQIVSVMAVALAVFVLDRPGSWGWLAAFFAAATLAFLSHVGIFPLLFATLFTLGALGWWRGGERRQAGLRIAGATALAAVVAVGSYYAHFPEVYRTLDRVSAPQASTQPSDRPAPAPLSVSERVARAGTLGYRALGLPLILAALGGAAILRRQHRGLAIVLLAWGVSFAVFVLFRTVAPVDARLQRYADEFIERVFYATVPAFALLAALAVTWTWRQPAAGRVAAVALGGAIVVTGVAGWMAWLQ